MNDQEAITNANGVGLRTGEAPVRSSDWFGEVVPETGLRRKGNRSRAVPIMLPRGTAAREGTQNIVGTTRSCRKMHGGEILPRISNPRLAALAERLTSATAVKCN